MGKLVLVDGNSIANRAFYGIMGSKMLTTSDGRYTNAVYGFLAILFKIMEDINPEYIVVSFDLKAPTERHKKYDGYKANRKGMPEELAYQMPMIKQILRAMNIDIVEMEGYEADDVLGTLSKYGEEKGLDVTILSGDRDTFQLATNKVTIRIPRTKMGKTETEEFDKNKIIQTYGVEPKQLIEVKGLQGDSSDNIPGVPGIGEKTALKLIQEYGSIENLYKKVEAGEDNLKGKQRENIVNNKELAELSRFLGTINLEVPIEDTLEDFKTEEWNKEEVLKIFKELKFKRYIDRFNLFDGVASQEQNDEEQSNMKNEINIKEKTIEEINKIITNQGQMIFYLASQKYDLKLDISETQQKEIDEKIIKEKITSISIYNEIDKETYFVKINNEEEILNFKEVFENKDIKKIGINMTSTYILLKQKGITLSNINYDIQIAAYILNPNNNKININSIIGDYLEIDVDQYLIESGIQEDKQEQINMFEQMTQKTNKDEEKTNLEKIKNAIYVCSISKIKNITLKKLEEINALDLFNNIDMPTVEVLSDMQWNGMYVDEQKLNEFGQELSSKLDIITKTIYEMSGEEFNINSTKQLGEVLFEKMKLPVIKKTKSGYSTDVDVLEKLKKEDPIIEQILEYRQLMKLNSTYIEGLKPYINPKTKRIHSFFHQTITATGRISSTEPNLQNIPTRFELGKRVREVFKPEEGKIYIDADYSQIELRVLAHFSNDKHMISAFENDEDIHTQVASKVFKTPIEEVTKEQRSNAKAVNFGIVYGISDYGLSEQLAIPVKVAKQYIEEYLEQYEGIKSFMENVKEQAKQDGYVETLFNRRRYIPELKSSNYMVRQFGARAAMNTPIQGTAADIMKISMINVLKELKKNNMKSKIVLQVHDEMMIEAPIDEKEQVKEIIKKAMEDAAKLKVPLKVDIEEGKNWNECK